MSTSEEKKSGAVEQEEERKKLTMNRYKVGEEVCQVGFPKGKGYVVISVGKSKKMYNMNKELFQSLGKPAP